MNKFKLIKYFLLAFLVSYCLIAEAQTSKVRSLQSTPAQLLDSAAQLRAKNPNEAILQIEKIFELLAVEEDLETEVKAYVLLGKIYFDIRQYNLALQRFEKASQVNQLLKSSSSSSEFKKEAKKKTTGKNELDGQIAYQKGLTYVQLEQFNPAQLAFDICIQNATNQKLVVQCKEGVVDISIAQKALEQSVQQINSIQSEYALDSSDIARFETKKAQVYVLNDDYSNANIAIENARFNNSTVIPAEQAVAMKELEGAIEENKKFSAEEKVELFRQNDYATDGNFSFSNQLAVVEVFNVSGDVVQAAELLSKTEDRVNTVDMASIRADFYKKSVEIKRKAGKYDAALKDLDLYIIEKEKDIQATERQLAQQIQVVQNQQRIDLRAQDFVLKRQEKQLLKSRLFTQQIINLGLAVGLVAAGIFFYFLRKNIRAKQAANKLLQLKSLRTQMNPHFIFNALNSVNNFIAKNDERAANKYLSDFSKLMRKVLYNGQSDLISLEDELELSKMYLQLEHFRFRDQFEFEWDNQLDIDSSDIQVPPMLIQPFIENAVWHGLRYKESKGLLAVTISETSDFVNITIQDDGIGRAKSQQIKTQNQQKHKSAGLNIVQSRVELINEVYDKELNIKTQDVDKQIEDTGTQIIIQIPKI